MALDTFAKLNRACSNPWTSSVSTSKACLQSIGPTLTDSSFSDLNCVWKLSKTPAEYSQLIFIGSSFANVFIEVCDEIFSSNIPNYELDISLRDLFTLLNQKSNKELSDIFLEILEELLEDNYDIKTAENGQICIDTVNDLKPDLIFWMSICLCSMGWKLVRN